MMNSDFKNLFIIEVKELLEQVERDILKLEEAPEFSKDLLEEIFRNLHSIKGAAGMYEFDNVVVIAHQLEEIYRKILNQELEFDEKIGELTLEAKDFIVAILDGKNVPKSAEIEKFIKSVSVYNPNLKSLNLPSYEGEKVLRTYYIVFEPNVDIYERAVNLTGIINDLEKFEYAFFKPFENKANQQKGKFNLFWEIIIATVDRAKLDSIFIFVKEEVDIKVLCDCNAFEIEGFREFYNKLGDSFSRERYYQLKQFIESNFSIGQEGNNAELRELSSNDYEDKTANLNYIKTPAKHLDHLLNSVSQLIVYNSQLEVAVNNRDIEQIKKISDAFQRLVIEIKQSTLSLRLVPISVLFQSYRRLVRDLAKKEGKKVRLIIEGEETMIDKTYAEKLYTPLLHLIRNAIDHGIELPEERLKNEKEEYGIVKLSAFQTNENLIIQVQDDGRGIDPDLIRTKAIELGLIKPDAKLTLEQIYNLVFQPGFTTNTSVNSISGRGIGMDAIRIAVRDLKGDIDINSELGLGTTVTLKLPVSLSIIDTLHVTVNDTNFLIPISNIVTIEKFDYSNFKFVSENQIYYKNKILPVIDIRKLMRLGGQRADEEILLVIDIGTFRYGLIFEDVKGYYNAVVKNLGAVFYPLYYFIGASVLGDGKIAYIIDLHKIIDVLTA